MILHKKQAFSLTELLIVLVVIAILFAAMAPIVTKRRNGADIANESVWNYVNDDENYKSDDIYITNVGFLHDLKYI